MGTNDVRTTMVPPVECSKCGADLSAATSVGPGSVEPEPGAASICGYCGNISMFNDDKKLRPPTGDERSQIESSHEYKVAMQAIAEFAEKHKFDNNWYGNNRGASSRRHGDSPSTS